MTRQGPGTWFAVRLGADKNPANGEIIAQSANRDEIQPLWRAGEIAICWSADPKPTRKLSSAGLASARRKRLRARLAKQAPLFAEQLEAQAIAAEPTRFDPWKAK